MRLVEHHDATAVSLYMTTHVTGRARRQDEIRLKNLLREASRQLDDVDADSAIKKNLLEPIQQIPKEPEIWDHRSEGLAVFSAQDFFTCHTLPRRFGELVVVDDQFFVSPLLPLLHSNNRYFILALTKDSAELYEATRSSIEEQELAEVEPIEVDGDQQPLQYHSHRIASASVRGSNEAIYHGRGGKEEREKTDITNFFKRQVEPGVSEALLGQQAPLVLACVDYLAPIYRDVNTYSHLVDDHVSGSPDEMNETELREQAWRVVQPYLKKVAADAQQHFHKLAATERTCQEQEPICSAAKQGRVDTLFVPADAATLAANRQQSANGADSKSFAQFIEDATKHTLLNSGRVLAVEEVPGDSRLAAILRY